MGLGILWSISKTLEFIFMHALLLMIGFPISCFDPLWPVKK